VEQIQQYTEEKQKQIRTQIAKKWIDPVIRAESIFCVRRGDGTLVSLQLPEPHKEILRNGILGKGRRLLRQKLVYRRCVNKGRQIGFSILLAIEAILIAQDYPNTFQYYIATRGEQSESWLAKVEQLVRDAKNWPKELGGTPILKYTDKGLQNKMTKVINGCMLQGLTANPAGLRGDTAINVILDEYAWMILRKNQQHETYTAIKHFLKQGGQLTAQSTPRVSNDLFWRFYDKGKSIGFDSYYKPTIENWKDLDLNSPLFIDFDNKRRLMVGNDVLTKEDEIKLTKKYLSRHNYFFDTKLNGITQKNIHIPYSWVNIIDLEMDRYQDVEMFKQENLGIPVDERYKLIIGEWIYPFSQEVDIEKGLGVDWDDRRDSYNPFTVGIDFAQKRDLTVITVIEQIGEHYYERRIEITQGKYTSQVDQIVQVYNLFKPKFIAIDYTGVGIAIGDMLEKRIGKSVLKFVTFTNSTKNAMAQNLKNICHDGKFHVLNCTEEHDLMIKHLLKVEKDVGETSTKYSGKNVDQEGRDDGFWSKALSVFGITAITTKHTKVAVRGVKRITTTNEGNKSSAYKELQNERLRLIKTKEQQEEQVVSLPDYKQERLDKMKDELSRGLIVCNKLHKPIKPYMCMCVDMPDCRYFKFHKTIAEKYGFTQQEAEDLLNGRQKIEAEPIIQGHN